MVMHWSQQVQNYVGINPSYHPEHYVFFTLPLHYPTHYTSSCISSSLPYLRQSLHYHYMGTWKGIYPQYNCNGLYPTLHYGPFGPNHYTFLSLHDHCLWLTEVIKLLVALFQDKELKPILSTLVTTLVLRRMLKKFLFKKTWQGLSKKCWPDLKKSLNSFMIISSKSHNPTLPCGTSHFSLSTVNS